MLYCFYGLISDRCHKNKVEQKPGWDANLLKWYLPGAKKASLKEQGYWGGFVLDEIITKLIKDHEQMGFEWFNIGNDGHHPLKSFVFPN